jgi:homoserine dehydrogenase
VEKVLVHDYNVILNDPEVSIVVETMGGLHPAYEFTKQALEAGEKVSVPPIRSWWRNMGTELVRIAEKKDINYLFEASCGGGIPIIRPFKLLSYRG